MKKIVTIADAKTRLIELVEQLAEEEEVIITRHGQPFARLVPVPRTRLFDHSISSPMPLSNETMPGELAYADSGFLELR
jgi:prevent-host-death family protein